MSGPCRLIILNAWSPTMSASFICNVIPIIIVLMMLTILGQSSLRLSARSGQWRCCCGANAWQVHFIFNECLADICHQSSSECLANTWKWFESTNNGRPCEDTITLTAEWENYPSREGGKTTKGEGGEVLRKPQCWQWTVFVRPRSVHGLVDCGQSWRSFPAEVLLSDGGGRGESAAHHQLMQSEENVRYKEFPKRNTNLQVTADQCHRGYTLASDSSNGLMSLNPLYIRFHQQQHLNPLLLHTSWKTQDQSPKADGLFF